MSEQRRAAIRSILTKYVVEDQEQLAQLLQEHYGIQAHQSIISRDMRLLGVSKQNSAEGTRYVLPAVHAEQALLPHMVLSIQHNDSLIVVHTKPACAGFVAEYIDTYAHEYTLGCIAGENTIFIAPKAGVSLKRSLQFLRTLLHVSS